MTSLLDISTFMSLIWGFISPFTWLLYLIPPIILAYLVNSAILFYKQTQFKDALDFQMFEIRIPRLVTKGPKAMEQFFNALASLKNEPGDWHDIYNDGEVPRWFTFEIASFGGRTRLFMRVPKKLRSTVEAMLYAQYSDIEITDIDPADDYVNALPDTLEGLKQIGYDLFGMEIYLAKAAPYPINTYENFETKDNDERIIDPMATMLEIFGKLKPEEIIWLQFIIKPINDNWKKDGRGIIKDIKMASMKEAESTTGMINMRTAGEDLRIKLIEKKLAQPGFDTVIRYGYFAPKEILNKDVSYRGLTAYFNQFAADNKFAKNNDTITRTAHWHYPYFFSDKRTDTRKDMTIRLYRYRWHIEKTFIGKLLKSSFWFPMAFDQKSSVLSSDELATLIHIPTDVVLTAPTMDRLDSKNVSPPSNLPS